MPFYTDSELEAYLEESLPAAAMAAIEATARTDPQLLERLAGIIGKRDAGVHSLGEIWRRHRVSCPPREQLGSYLLGVLDENHTNYIRFHLTISGCRFCQANLEDLQQRHADSSEVVASRRHKYFQSSAGYLKRE